MVNRHQPSSLPPVRRALTCRADRLTIHADPPRIPPEARLRESTVAASLLIDLAHQLAGLGIERDRLCREARLDPLLLERPHERVPGAAAARLWQAAERLTGDPLLGLHVAERYRAGAMSILGYVILNCRTPREALDRLARFAALLNDGLRVRVASADGQVVVAFEPIDGLDNFLLRDGRQVIETMAAGVVLTLRQLTGTALAPARVTFRHRAGGPVAEYHRLFGVPVRFGQPDDAVAFRAAALDSPIPASDPALLALFEGHARVRLDELERLGGTTQRVARVVAARLRGAAPSIAEVARDLATSARQLQRALAAEGTTFQRVLDGARRDVALARLRLPGATAAEVALLLGFSEASAFSRAFRRWTGITPGAYAAGEAPRDAA